MAEVRARKSSYLTLDELTPNLKLARRLPAVLAQRFHALPLAEDQGQVTVAMANPDDPAARKAVADALGSAPCLVQGDPAAIDAMLAGIWGHETPSVTMAICDFPRPMSEAARSYARALGNLLAARLTCLDSGEQLDSLASDGREIEGVLYLVEEPGHPLLRRLLATGAGQEGIAVPLAMLVTSRPRWPINRILLIICGDDRDKSAADWVLRLARRSGCAVTVLAVVPPSPAMYGQPVCGDSGLPALLSSETLLGRQMRQVARQLVDWGIEGTLRLRQGPPNLQISREIAESDCDLVVVSSRPCHWLLRWLGKDLAEYLLQWSDRPLLLARPASE